MEWKISAGITPYLDAMATMEARQKAVQAGEAEGLVWLLEHPPLYTAGRSAKAQDLLSAQGFDVYEAGRGGQYTYHGPGQRVVYVVLDLAKHGKDVRAYVKQLEQWIIDALAQFNQPSFTREGRVGVWVNKVATHSPLGQNYNEAKIAALGVRVQKWVTSHGIAINVNPDLTHYNGIVPCGLVQFGVTSLHDMGHPVTMQQLDSALKATCPFTR